MQKRMVLTGPADAVVFVALVQGFLEGKTSGEESKGKDAIRRNASIKKALFQCGEIMDIPLRMPVATQDDQASLDRLNEVLYILHSPECYQYRVGKAIRLKEGVQEIVMAEADWERLDKHVTQSASAWPTVRCEDAEEMFDRLARLEPIAEGP